MLSRRASLRHVLGREKIRGVREKLADRRSTTHTPARCTASACHHAMRSTRSAPTYRGGRYEVDGARDRFMYSRSLNDLDGTVAGHVMEPEAVEQGPRRRGLHQTPTPPA